MEFLKPSVPSENDRVRRNTSPKSLAEIDAKIEENIRYYSSQPGYVINQRIDELEREWSMERWIEANASSLALTGLVLSLTVSKKWVLLTGGVLSFLLLHAVQGWCPPVPVLRRLGVRTRSEIEKERYALKLLRGDFRSVAADPEVLRSSAASEVYNAVSV